MTETTDRTTATAAEFDAVLARVEAAEADQDGAVERMVDALYAVKWDDGEPYIRMARSHVRRIAVAALAAAPKAPAPETDEALRRVEAEAEHMAGSGSAVYRKAAASIRAALAGPTP